jgi:DUF1365 family protein
MNPHLGEVDSMAWTPSHHSFAVKSYYTMLQLSEHNSFPWKKHLEGEGPSHCFILMGNDFG